MIKIVFKKSENMYIDFKVTGHADYAELGKDIVCSSVSTAAQFVIMGIVDVEGYAASYVAEEGNISLDLSKLSKEEVQNSQPFMITLYEFLNGITKTYKNYLKVKIEEV
ncbi:MAG TPA: ribosomal-processing cysteine protease Prp [Clostridiaceae bacterium]